MTHLQDAPARTNLLATYGRPPAIAATWLVLTGLATGCFFAPRGAEAQPTMDDVVGFGGSLAIAGAAAATVAFAIGGRRRWALEVAISVTLVSAIVALLLVYFLWFDPTIARRHLNLWEFRRLQGRAGRWAEQIPTFHAPLGTGVGIVLGAVAGLLTVLARRMPRLATGGALALLFACASGPGRQFAFDQVVWWGWKLRFHLVPWSISDDQIAASGMIFGAIAGAVIAGLAMYAGRKAS